MNEQQQPWSAVRAAALRVGAAQHPERCPSVTFSQGRRGAGDVEAKPVSSASRGWAASVLRGVQHRPFKAQRPPGRVYCSPGRYVH